MEYLYDNYSLPVPFVKEFSLNLPLDNSIEYMLIKAIIVSLAAFCFTPSIATSFAYLLARSFKTSPYGDSV